MSDVVDVLLGQHEEARTLFVRTLGATGQEKIELFAVLVEKLQAHERAEQEVVHPVLAEITAASEDVLDDHVAEDILAEERAADRQIAQLIALGVGHSAFDRHLADFQSAVIAHAAHEEEQEFPLLRSRVEVARLQEMGAQVLRSQTQAWSS
jgi:hemerythrin superfamily protein